MDLIIGAGEIGISLQKVFDCEIRDKEPCKIVPPANTLHIAFPYGTKFSEEVLNYIKFYDPNLTIIHSTVQIGETEAIRALAQRPVVHSPVMGKHPDLARHIKKFTKFIGAETRMEAQAAVSYFNSVKVKSMWLGRCRTTELAKLMSTTQYGLMIAFHQEMQRICKEANVPFEIITEWNKHYNKGYDDWNTKKYQRPILKPGFIGGHCVMPNISILKDFYESPFFDVIEESNEKWRKIHEPMATMSEEVK